MGFQIMYSFKAKGQYLLKIVLTFSILSECLFMTPPNLGDSDLPSEKHL